MEFIISQGLKENLPEGRIAGRLLITTDTGEMYLDKETIDENGTLTSTSRIQLGSGIGKQQGTTGLIFNDYENNQALATYATSLGYNNIAGIKGFKILEIHPNECKFVLDNAEGLSIGMKYSCQINNNFDLYGTITEINFTDNSIIVDKFPTDTTLGNSSYLWIPSSPLLGTTSLGSAALAVGYSNKSNQVASFSAGYNNIASGKYSCCLNKDNIAAWAAFAHGSECQALGQISRAGGSKSIASGYTSIAEGTECQATGSLSIAMGRGAKSTNYASMAVNVNTEANGNASFACGTKTKALGDHSFASGSYTSAHKSASSSFGYFTNAAGDNQMAIGQYNQWRGAGCYFVVGSGKVNKYGKNILKNTLEVYDNNFIINSNQLTLNLVKEVDTVNADNQPATAYTLTNAIILKNNVLTFLNPLTVDIKKLTTDTLDTKTLTITGHSVSTTEQIYDSFINEWFPSKIGYGNTLPNPSTGPELFVMY